MPAIRHALAGLSSILLLFTLLAAAPPSLAAQHLQAKTDRLSIAITTTGSTVWGKVTVKYTHAGHKTSAACTTAHCQFHVPQGTTVHLTQSQMDAATWPFSKWQLKSATKTINVTTSTATIHMTGPMTVTAVYVLKQAPATSPTRPANPYNPYP
jgi:hypothetical protein